MNRLITIGIGLCCGGLAACAYQPFGNRPDRPVTLSWAAASSDNTASESFTYNVYAVPGAGPIPTEVSKACGVTSVAKGRPLNSEPIVGTTYQTSLAEGLWTFAVEAVSSNGCRSTLSSPVTITVPIPNPE
jgi:hypothetical protein